MKKKDKAKNRLNKASAYTFYILIHFSPVASFHEKEDTRMQPSSFYLKLQIGTPD